MPEAATKTTTTPRRRAAGTSTRKPPATKAQPVVKEEAPATEDKVEKTTPPAEDKKRARFELVYAGDTKSYAKFDAPAELAGIVVGQLYFPHGTDRVVVTVLGPDDVITDIQQD